MAGIAELLTQVFAIDPSRGAVEHDDAWWSWGDLDLLQKDLNAAFAEIGIPEGGRIGILFHSRPQHVAALVACGMSTRCAVAFNSLFPADKLGPDVLGQDVSIIVGEAADLARPEIAAAINQLKLPAYALPTQHQTKGAWANDFRTPPAGSLKKLRPDVLIEMLSSGTTGTPKRIPLTRSSFEHSFEGMNAYESGRQEDTGPTLRSGVRIVSAPLTHISGIAAVLMSLAGGRPVALLEKFSVPSWVGAVKRHKAKVINAPPTALRMVLDANVPKEDLASLVAVRSGTAPVPPELIDEYLERYNIPILQQYGATEFAGGVAGWTINDFRKFYATKRGSVGRIQADIEARIIDMDTGAVLPAGQEGLVELRGAQLGDPQAWLRTTDKAVLDEDGFLFILGRADNAIIRGGFKVHPDEVVKAMMEHPAIMEAAVVGIPDKRLGAVPASMVIVRAGHTAPTPEELNTFLRTKLTAYQVPVLFKIVQDFPRTGLLKPATGEIQAILKDEVEALNA